MLTPCLTRVVVSMQSAQEVLKGKSSLDAGSEKVSGILSDTLTRCAASLGVSSPGRLANVLQLGLGRDSWLSAAMPSADPPSRCYFSNCTCSRG